MHVDGFRMEISIKKKVEGNPLSAVTGLFAVTLPSNPVRCCRGYCEHQYKKAHVRMRRPCSASVVITYFASRQLLWVVPVPDRQYNGEKEQAFVFGVLMRMLPHLRRPSDHPSIHDSL